MALGYAPDRARSHGGQHRLVGLVRRGARWLALASDTPARASGAGDPPAAAAAPALPAEFEHFIHEFERPVLNYLWRLTGEEQTAYDLTQEVFLRAWQRFAVIRAYDNPRAWLFRVASNLAFTYLRRRKFSAAVLAHDATFDPAASDPALRLAERDAVRVTLLALPPRRRAALVLREVYGLSAAEIGAALGLSAAAVRMELHRAREQFRVRYQAEGSADDGANT